MAHEMNEGVVRWAAQRARFALEALEAHDKETRRLLDQRAAGKVMVAGAFDGRSDARIDLAAQVAETSRVLVRAVLGSGIEAELAREGCCTREDSCSDHAEVVS